MGWTAKVTKKEIVSGVVSVTLEFTDGQKVITETYRATAPNEDWIPQTAKSRIGQLATVYSYDVSIGDVVIPADKTVDINVSLFAKRWRLMLEVKVAIDMGVVKADNAKVIALVEWLKANFDAYADTLR